MRLGIIVNPRARRAGRVGFSSQLAAICKDVPDLRVHVCETHSPSELDEAMRRLADRGIDILAPCGGDGTMTATLTAAYQVFGSQLPHWLPLAGGTMNTIARNLGAHTPPEQRLRQLCEAIRSGQWHCKPQATIVVHSDGEVPLSLTTGRPCTDEQPEQKQRIGFLGSAAMGARFLAAYSASPHRGILSASVLALRTIASSLIPGGGPLARWLFAPLTAQLRVDGTLHSEPTYRLLIASTVPDVGLGMRVPWQAGSVSDRFHLIASSLSTVQNALQVPRMLRGLPLCGQPHLDVLARQTTLTFAQPEPIVLDGELFCAQHLDLNIGPTLCVISPGVAPQGIEPRTLRV
ncbi:MAG: hypothetical protein JNM40_01525 [Myxococcales bacterium]|nr:hypothetical protein [Myxococcales bacterium]